MDARRSPIDRIEAGLLTGSGVTRENDRSERSIGEISLRLDRGNTVATCVCVYVCTRVRGKK